MRTLIKVLLGVFLGLLITLVGLLPLGPAVQKQSTLLLLVLVAAVGGLLLAELWPTRRMLAAWRTWRLLVHDHGAPSTALNVSAYWGTAPAEQSLVGRDREERELAELIGSGPRIIGVFGPPGIGKTSIVATVARQRAGRFEYVLWHSLQTAPPLREVLDRWLAAVGVTPQSERLTERLDLLLAFLAQRSCLVVFDGSEVVVGQEKDRGKETATHYHELFERIFNKVGRSTVIITSTIIHEPFQRLGPATRATIIELRGLRGAAVGSLLTMSGAAATREEAKRVEAAYTGNPQAILILGAYVRSAYAGRLSRLLETEGNLVAFNQFTSLIERQLSTLTEKEHLLVLWLAIWREPASLGTLHWVLSDHLGFADRASAGELVTALRAKQLLIDTSEGVSLSGFLLELVTQYLVRTISDEILGSESKLLALCPLSQASWPDRVRAYQRRFVLRPIVERIARAGGVPPLRVKSLLREQLSVAHDDHAGSGYTTANQLYLLEVAGDELTDLMLDGRLIKGADFRSSWLHRSKFVGSDLSGSEFAQPFGTLHAVALSPDQDGGFLAAGTALGKVLVWNTATGELVSERQIHSGVVRSLCFSADSRRIHSVAEDGRLASWSFGDGELDVFEKAHSNWIWQVIPWPGHDALVTAGCDGYVRIWLTLPLRLMTSLPVPSDWTWCVSFSEGQLLCGSEDGSVWSWELVKNGSSHLPTRECRLEVRLPAAIKAMVASKLSLGLVYLGCADGTIYRLNTRSQECIPFGPRHNGPVRSLVQLGEPTLMASAGDDRLIRLWESSSGALVRLMEGHSSRVWSLAGHPTNAVLASASDDRSVRIWCATATHPELSVHGFQHVVRTLDVDASARLIAVCGDDLVRRWEIYGGPSHTVLTRRHKRITAARSIREDVVSAADDGSIAVAGRSRETEIWQAHAGAIECLRVHPGRELIGSGGEDRIGRIWSLSGGLISELVYHHNRIWDMAFSPDGRYVATGGGDYAVGLWETDTGRLKTVIPAHRNLVLAVAWVNDSLLLSGSSDGTVKCWQIAADGHAIPEQVWARDVGCVVRAVIAIPDTPPKILVGGRTRFPQSGSKLVCLNAGGVPIREAVNTLKWSIHALAIAHDRQAIFVGGDGSEIVELTDATSLSVKQRWRIDGPYQGADFTCATGLTNAQRACLRELGAHVDNY